MLDPERVKLSAANIGFLKQKGIAVDFNAVRKALQTDDGGCVKVRREADTPVNELHVMGGQRLGLEGNMNIQEYARQARQMNGYPLRSFSANAPAVILPPKYGGFPQYVNNESDRENYVSRFTEPLSAPLQQNTMLLGPQGFSVSSNSASDPFKPLGFEMNMHKSKDAVDYNEIAFRQAKFLQAASMRAQANKGLDSGPMEGGSGGGPNPRITASDGVFIGADGKIMTQVQDAASGAFFQNTVYGRQQDRVRSYQRFETPASDNGRYLNLNNTGGFYRSAEERLNLEVLDDNASTLFRDPNPYTELNQSDNYSPEMTAPQLLGMQAGSLSDIRRNIYVNAFSDDEGYRTAKETRTPKKTAKKKKNAKITTEQLLGMAGGSLSNLKRGGYASATSGDEGYKTARSGGEGYRTAKEYIIPRRSDRARQKPKKFSPKKKGQSHDSPSKRKYNAILAEAMRLNDFDN